jgi:hypothetical protein
MTISKVYAMSGGKQRFTKCEIKRALAAVEEIGHAVEGFQIATDGTIKVTIGKLDKPDDTNEWDSVK